MATLNVGNCLQSQKNDFLVSPNKAYYFKLTEHGNLLVIDDIGHVHWISETCNKGTKPYKLTLEEDRNLILRDGSGVPTWSSNTWSPTLDPTAKLSILNNRDVVLSGIVNGETQVLWSTNTAMPIKSTLYIGDTLYPGKVLLSPNLKYCLRMQKDGNIALYDENNTYWSSNTVLNFGNYTLVLQWDNNFAAYGTEVPPYWSPIWDSGTNSHNPTSDLKVVLQNDKNLVMYANNISIWSVPKS